MTLRKLALFDLDHTLIPIDSDYAWGEFTTARGWTDSVEFKRSVVLKATQPQALELVGHHQRAGDTVIIVTATNAFVTRPIAQAFGVSELIAVELEREATPEGPGWFTGAIQGTPSFREGKVTRVEQWLQARGLTWDTVHTTFYTDSINDLPLLERSSVAVATNPDPLLRAIAVQRQWRILDLFA